MLLKGILLFYGGNTNRKGKIMNSIRKIDENLKNVVRQIVANKEQYVKNPVADFTRKRKMSMEDVINQILFMTGGSLKRELYNTAKTKKMKLTPAAFVQQRSKISSSAFKDIFYRFNDCCKDAKKHRGYRLMAVDGTEIDCSRNPQSEYFTVHSQRPEGFNAIHLNALYDICNQTYIDIEYQSLNEANERTALIDMLCRYNSDEKTLIICDRGYESYNVFAHFMTTPNVDFLCRVNSGNGAMKEIKELPLKELDIDISVDITTTQTNEDKQKGRRFIQTANKKGKANSPKTHIRRWDFPSPYTLEFRVVRVLLDNGEYETLATSLSREEFSIKELKELYHMRWDIETSFRDLKYSIGLTHLHSKKDDLVLQEIYAAIIMYNFCVRIARSVVINKQQKCKYVYEINLSMAVHICKQFCRAIKKDYGELIADISSYTEPIRPGRKDKRNLQAKRFVGFIYRVAA